MADVFDDFPGLTDREQEAEKAAELLQRAAMAVTAMAPNEDWSDVAARLRGAATFAQAAATELLVTSGWFEAAHTAANAGLLDAVELPTDPQATEEE